MPSEITMPQQTDTMTEGTVVKWLKKEGDRVKSGEPIAEVETDKATMEMEALDGGTLAYIAAPEGAKVLVGALMAVLATGKENADEVKKQFANRAPAMAQATEQKQPVAASASSSRAPAPPASHGGTIHSHEGASSGELHEPDEAGHGSTRSRPVAVPAMRSRGGNGHDERVFASPVARRVASDKGIDLSQIRGSGPRGRITRQDVLNFAENPPIEPKPAKGPPPEAIMAPRVPRGEKQVVSLTRMRAAIAAGLQKSKQTVPHFYETIDIDVEELFALRGRINKQLDSQGIKLSISDFITKAVASTLLRHPQVNAHFTGDSITRFGDVNLGIAVAVPDGLIVPVLRGVDQMGLQEIRSRSEDLIARARNQKLKQDEMRGATFTISNLGTFGVREFSAIINPPEVGILAVAAAEKRAVVRGDQIVARMILSVTLSADHRAVDGAVAADFLRTLKQLLEEPAMMMV
jgi:pyruvate dehydrogenase E2 component (dihydrolipoamide acetyltransferase)